MTEKATARSNDYWTRLANLGALWTLVLVIGFAVLTTLLWYGEDFMTFYAPAKVFAAGLNPYDYAQIVATILRATGNGGNSPFYYPMWIIFPLIPLAFLPLQLGRCLWLIVQVVFLVAGLLVTEKLVGQYPAPWIRWVVWLAAFVLFGWSTLRAEQVACAIFFDWALCLWAIRQNRVKTAAVALALLLIKPNITFLPFMVLCGYLWFRERSIVLRAIAVVGMLFLISTAVIPGWWAPILEGRLPNGWNQGLTGFEVDARRLTTTTSDFLDYNLGIQGAPAVLVELGIGLFSACLIWRGRHDVLYDSLLAIPLGLMLTPYAMQYDYALLIPAFLWVLHRSPQISRSKQIALVAGLVFLASVLLWEKPISDGLWMPMTLIVLLLVAAPTARRSREEFSPGLTARSTAV